MAARKRIAARRGWPANLYLNSKGYYWFRHPGTKKTFGLGKDFKIAAAKVRTVNAELERRKGAVDLLHRIDGSDVSLIEWCNTYEEKRKGLKPNTLAGIRAALNATRELKVAVQAVGKITPKEMADALNEIVEKRGSSSAAKWRTIMLDVFREAIEQGKVEVGKNPIESIFVPDVTITRSRLTLDDFKRIHAEALKDPADRWIANAMMLALVSGQRREDIWKMEFGQIQDGFLLIQQSKGREGMQAKLRIPLQLRLDAVGQSLGDVLKSCRDNVISKYAIHLVRKTSISQPGDQPSISYISMRFAALRDAAKVEVSEGKTPATFHEIRSLAARLYAEQYGAEFAQALLGHKSAEMTALYRDSRGREWTEIKIGAR
ncbi:tyrosine-type recombinase/integrase [Burkholderia multivorans]|nr:tyrosine-type recombinase/integrase [Burkholderia multivorans]